MAKFNCMTYALRVEDSIQNDLNNLDILRTPQEAINEVGKKCNRIVREIESIESPINPNEWKIIFWGWVVSKFNYDGFPVRWDYHFVLQNEDGTFSARKTWDAPVEKVDLDKLIAEYEKYGYNPKYFAVRKLEE